MPSTAGIHFAENLSILARSEKRLLVWMAIAFPAINSDHLSLVGLVAMAAPASRSRRFASRVGGAGVIASLAANWFGDSLDGTLARVRHQQRPRYGFYVDHVIDVAGSALLFHGYGCFRSHEPARGADGPRGLSARRGGGVPRHARAGFSHVFFGFGPTELRMLLIVGAIQAAVSPQVSIGSTSAAAVRRRRGHCGGGSDRVRRVLGPQHAGAVSRGAAAPGRIERGAA